MTQIYFYHNAADRIAAAAGLIGKACSQRKALLVFAPDEEIASTLDRYLWMHPPTGFIPHVRNDSPLAGQALDGLQLRKQHGINVIAIERRRTLGRELRKLMSWVKSQDDDYTEGTATR